jgi:hypothetical protein
MVKNASKMGGKCIFRALTFYQGFPPEIKVNLDFVYKLSITNCGFSLKSCENFRIVLSIG